MEVGEDLCSKQELLTKSHYGGKKHCPLLACVFIAEAFLIRLAGRALSPLDMFLRFCLLVFGQNLARNIPQHRLNLTSGLVDTCSDERERLT